MKKKKIFDHQYITGDATVNNNTAEKFWVLLPWLNIHYSKTFVGRAKAQAISHPVSHRGGPASLPGQSTWDLWLSEWQWDRIFSELLCFPLSISFHCGSPYSCITWGMNNRPIGGCSSETYFHPHRHEQEEDFRYMSQYVKLCHILTLLLIDYP
jgi:hypothetical protein